MGNPARGVQQIIFDNFAVDVCAGELRKFGTRIKLQERPLLLLVALLEKPGEVVTREELRQRLWPDGTFVDFDHSISSCVNRLRGALSDSPKKPKYIETVGRRGYRFIGTVIPAEATVPSAPVESARPATETAVPSERSSLRRFLLPASIIALVLLGIAAALFRSQFRSRPQEANGRFMLAVLPFENLTGDTTQEYFSDGLTEEMISQLGQLDPQRLGVIARASVMRYKNNGEALKQAGADLGVQYVLEGSVRRDSEKVRIAVQLIRVTDQTQVWTRQYDRELSNLLALQSEIAQEVANEIKLTLTEQQLAGMARPPSLSKNAYDSYDLYLKGRYFWNKRTVEGFNRAISFFQQAIDKDPGYARAYVGLADSYAMMASYGLAPPGELIPKARAAALRALELDEGLAEAHTSLALVAQNYEWDWTSAEKQFRRAIQLDPNYATAHQWYAESLAFQGRFEEALVESEIARRLDPVSPIIAADCGAIYFFSRQYDRAIDRFRAARQLDPEIGRAHLVAYAYTKTGKFEEALAEIKGWTRPEEAAWASAANAYVYGQMGQQEKANRALRQLDKLSRMQDIDPAPMHVIAYAGMGDKDKSIAWLQKAFEAHSIAVIDLKVNPIYDPLRNDPRFQDLLHKIGF